MIVHEAVCESADCGHRVPAVDGTRHPDDWTVLISTSGKQHFCSYACMREKVAGPATRTRVPAFVASYLSDRDMRALTLVAQGKSNKEIGAVMGVVEATIKNRVSRLMMHVGGRDRIELMLFAEDAGIINLHVLAQRFVRARNADVA